MGRYIQAANPEALKKLIEDSGVSYRTNKRSYIFTCPRCQKPGKLMMLKESGRYICWVCAETSAFKGRPEFALRELLGMDIKRLQELLYGTGGAAALDPEGLFQVSLHDFYGDDPVPQDVQEQVKGLRFPLDFYPIDHKHSANGLKYLEGRGIPLDVAKEYGLRYCPVQRRVIFPIQVGPKLVGWQARAIFDTSWEDDQGFIRSAPKILTTGPRDAVVMFQDNLEGSDHAIICEGPVDALKCHLAGGFVATMGKVVSERQIEIVRRSGVKKVYIALDPDAGSEAMRLTRAFADMRLYRLLPARGFKDLGEMTAEGVLRQFQEAPRIYPGMLFTGLVG